MNIKTVFQVAFLLLLLLLGGCGLSDDDKEKLYDAQVDLEQLADQIIITYPANQSVVTDSVITVRADIPAAAEAQEVSLFVDGIEVAKDTDGAPWEISWPAYYWADGGAHTLLLKTVTGAGNEVRNNQQHQVTIDTQANNFLRFSDGVDGQTIKDLNSLPVEFEGFPGATSYEVRYSNGGNEQMINAASTGVELTGLDVGQYELRYRAIVQYSELTTLTGPWSNSVFVEVLPPDLPVIDQPVISKTDTGYDLLLSWEDIGEGNTYTIYLNNLSNSGAITPESTTNNSILFSGLDLGEYEWQLKRTNSLDQDSVLSEPEVLEIGIFSIHLGGSRDDRAKQIIASMDGGYVILGYTKSYEVSDTVDSQGDDWIIKVNDQGEVVWDYFSSAGGRDRFNDLIELSDGAIVAVGNDWDTQQAVALKLDDNGNSVWEVFYRPSNVSERYDFREVVEYDNALIFGSAEWGPGSCVGCTTVVNSYLHTASSLDGTVSDPINIPSLSGLTIRTIDELLVTSEGNLLVSGTAMPEVVDPADMWSEGAYLQVLDNNFVQLATWNDVGKTFHINVGDAIELSNGNFAVIGQNAFGGEPTISVVSSSGAEIRNYTSGIGQEFYGSQSIVSGENGEIYGLFQDQNTYSYPYPLTFMAFNSNLVVESQSYLLDFKEYVDSVGLVKNNDGTFTLLFNEGQNGNNNYDIVLVKRKMN